MKGYRAQKGFLLITAIILIAVIGILAVVVSYLVIAGTSSSLNQMYKSQSFYTAESGLNYAKYYLTDTRAVKSSSGRKTCPDLNGYSAYVDSGASKNQFVLNTNQNVGSSDLSDNISASASSLSVGNGSVFSSGGGKVVIDGEIIKYGAISGKTLDYLTRGVDGTAASAHTSGAVVSQAQCVVSSSGFVPNDTSPFGVSALRQSYQLEAGFAVGEGIYDWNGKNWSSMATPSSVLESISMLSYHDAWAVGVNGVIYHWNGSAWSSVTSPTIFTLNGVVCLAHDDCWAVGDDYKVGRIYNITFVHYDGSSWVDESTSGGGSDFDVDLRGISCPAQDDCWAVGMQGKVYNYNGTQWSYYGDIGNDLYALSCINADNCRAVGKGGVVYLWDGSSWSLETTLGNSIFKSIFCLPDGQCWAGNDAGDIYHYNGSSWDTGFSIGSPNNHEGIYCLNDKNCWSSMSNGDICHYDGNIWKSVVSLGDGFLELAFIGPHNQPASHWREE